MAAEEVDVKEGERVLAGRYRLGGLLGRGGMATVHDGYDERLHRSVAVKLLRPELAVDPEVRTRFEAEARSAARLAHPNAVAVFDTGEDAGMPFIVMERLPGETLADRMAAGRTDPEWLRRVAGDVLGALGAAHAAGLIHRDVKPSNILIGEDGCAKMGDFGIAKSAEVAADITGTGLLVGTPAYLAPERLDGVPATASSDLYSLGVVLYEALAGRKPFGGSTAVAVAAAVAAGDPPPLEELRPDVDRTLAAAVARAMSRDPSGRPGSAAEMARLLTPGPEDPTVGVAAPGAMGAFGDGTAGVVDPTLVGAPGPVPVSPSPAPAGAGRRRTWVRRPAALVVGIVAVALLLLLLGTRGGADGSRAALAADLDDLAGRVAQGDGPMGPEASEGLEAVAGQVRAGGGADDAQALMTAALGWNAEGRLSGAATTQLVALLDRIPGVDPPPTTTTTTLAPPPPVVADNAGGGEDEGKSRGKRKDRDD